MIKTRAEANIAQQDYFGTQSVFSDLRREIHPLTIVPSRTSIRRTASDRPVNSTGEIPSI